MADCPQTSWLSNEDFLRNLGGKVWERRIPYSGSVDLTHRCNLRCVHCYLGGKGSPKGKRDKELNAADWISLIDQIVDAGCLHLLLTGGDPLLRDDFAEVYSHAKETGLLVSIFTNGTLVTNEIIELLRDLPPHSAEITLYGATAQTYEKITRVKGSYEKCLSGIRQLLDHKINLKLKTVLMSLNRHEFHKMEDMAKGYGVPFRFDAAIFPRFDGDQRPARLRVSPEEAIEKEFSGDRRVKQWRDYFEKMQGLQPSDALYNCGAGLMSFHIGPYGVLKPCLMVQDPKYSLRNGDFVSGWMAVMPRLTDTRADPGFACNRCKKKALCGYCPAFFALENGAEEIRSEYLCMMGQHRYKSIHDISTGERSDEIGR